MNLKSSIKRVIKSTIFYKNYKKRRDRIKSQRVEYLRRFFHEESEEMLRSFSNALNKAGIKFWLEFGTLLGYYREHGFIPHDFDIDTGTYYENINAVKSALESAGFKLVREYEVLNDGGIEQCYLYKHTTIDVFYFRKEGDVMYCNSFYPLPSYDMSKKKYVNRVVPFGVKRIEVPYMDYIPAIFMNCNVFVPKDTDRYLRTHYGDDYMIPNPKYDNKKDSTNITWYSYEEKQGQAMFKLPYFGHPEDYGLL